MLEWYSLTRRFSVLRNSSGEPIRLDELKNKFAEQRARGSQNQVTEEEEDMILEALGRFHGRSRSRGKQSGVSDGEGRGSAADGEDDDADADVFLSRPGFTARNTPGLAINGIPVASRARLGRDVSRPTITSSLKGPLAAPERAGESARRPGWRTG